MYICTYVAIIIKEKVTISLRDRGGHGRYSEVVRDKTFKKAIIYLFENFTSFLLPGLSKINPFQIIVLLFCIFYGIQLLLLIYT